MNILTIETRFYPSPTNGKVDCEIVDIYFPLFKEVREKTDKAVLELPENERASMQIMADELTQALVGVSRDEEDSVRVGIIEKFLTEERVSSLSETSQAKLSEVVSMIAQTVEDSGYYFETDPRTVPFMFRNSQIVL